MERFLNINDKKFIKEFILWLKNNHNIEVEKVEISLAAIRFKCKVDNSNITDNKRRHPLSGEFDLIINNDFYVHFQRSKFSTSLEEELSLFLREYLLINYGEKYAEVAEEYIQKELALNLSMIDNKRELYKSKGFSDEIVDRSCKKDICLANEQAQERLDFINKIMAQNASSES